MLISDVLSGTWCMMRGPVEAREIECAVVKYTGVVPFSLLVACVAAI